MTPDERATAAARALPLVDLTNLNADCTREDIETLVTRAHTKHGNVGAICIWPRYVAHAHKLMAERPQGKEMPIATVINFPGGTDDPEQVAVATRSALDDGADEIDLVIPYRDLKSGDEEAVTLIVSTAAAEVKGRGLLKVIIETGELESEDLIRRASELAIDAGADFIKTSTGKVDVNATPEAAGIMLQVIADRGKPVGFKPAGGVKTVEDTVTYLALADRIMGPDWTSPQTFRFGASGVLDDLIAALDGRVADVGEGY